jgi:hypothetical protein
LKNAINSQGIEPAAFRLVAKCLNNYYHVTRLHNIALNDRMRDGIAKNSNGSSQRRNYGTISAFIWKKWAKAHSK